MTFIGTHMRTRPNLFYRMMRSLSAQTDQDFEHLVYCDHRIQGAAVMYTALPQLAKAARGTYLHIIDDDDWMEPDFIENCKRILRGDTPDYFATHYERVYPGPTPDTRRVSHLPRQPLDQEPQLGKVTHAMINIKPELYIKYADEGRGYQNDKGEWVYEGDFWLIKRLYDAGLRPIDLGFVGSRGNQAGLGKSEAGMV